MSSCQRSFGLLGGDRWQLLFGRLWGFGVTNPRADRIRQIVDTAGTAAGPPRPRRYRGGAVALLQVGGDGGRTGLVPAPVELFAQLDDPGFGTVQGYSAQDAGGVSTGGTDGQPVRTLSMIGLAACSTTPTEAAILPRLVETLS